MDPRGTIQQTLTKSLAIGGVETGLLKSDVSVRGEGQLTALTTRFRVGQPPCQTGEVAGP